METYRKFLKSDRWREWKKHETDQRKGAPVPPPQKSYPEDAPLIELVAPDDIAIGQMPVIEAFRRRRSRREFTEEPMTLEELSFLLWATQGIDDGATQAFGEWLATKDLSAIKSRPILRTVPSAGGRHPFETYLLLNRVRGLDPGLYRYLSVEHKLLFLRAGTELSEQVADAFMSWVQRSAVLFIWATIPYRTEWRYSIVAHKMIAQESGHICQNLYLACEAIGAGTCAITHDQVKVDTILGVDGKEEFAIYVAPMGKVTPAEYHFDH
ncbi:MAG: SagB/ThcOx family dehydrogenase [Candidatus Promineifilaceae bacterium]